MYLYDHSHTNSDMMKTVLKVVKDVQVASFARLSIARLSSKNITRDVVKCGSNLPLGN